MTSGLEISPPLQESLARNGKTPVKHHQNSRGPQPRSLSCNNPFYSSANVNRNTTTMVRHFHPTHHYQHTRRQHHQHTRRRHCQHPPCSQQSDRRSTGNTETHRVQSFDFINPNGFQLNAISGTFAEFCAKASPISVDHIGIAEHKLDGHQS
jgi:hypothetical protein